MPLWPSFSVGLQSSGTYQREFSGIHRNIHLTNAIYTREIAKSVYPRMHVSYENTAKENVSVNILPLKHNAVLLEASVPTLPHGQETERDYSLTHCQVGAN